MAAGTFFSFFFKQARFEWNHPKSGEPGDTKSVAEHKTSEKSHTGHYVAEEDAIFVLFFVLL